MVNDDALELRIDVEVLSTDSVLTEWFAAYKHAQGADSIVVISPPVPCPTASHGIVFTLKQTEGTSRNFKWSIIEYT
jgi:hypothetical protein